jgi:hypothetical protein
VHPFLLKDEHFYFKTGDKCMANGIQNYITAKKKIQGMVANCSHFVIGKAGKDRLDDHKNGYDKIESIHESSRSKDIDNMAFRLSGIFLETGKSPKNRLFPTRHNKTQPKCDNKEPVKGEMRVSDSYCVYVAVKD